jgi:hypothetical protein
MNERVETRLSLIVLEPGVRSFCLLTGSGFKVGIEAACTLRELVCGRLGVEPACLESRIQTIFLNHKAVDDPHTAVVTAGATIGLSGAMPGIAGAMLRKDSCLASMRSPISRVAQNGKLPTRQEGEVTVRLFNVLQEELSMEKQFLFPVFTPQIGRGAKCTCSARRRRPGHPDERCSEIDESQRPSKDHACPPKALPLLVPRG